MCQSQAQHQTGSQMYYIDVTDTNGCVVSDSIYLSSNDPILANLTFDDISCHGGSDELHANQLVEQLHTHIFGQLQDQQVIQVLVSMQILLFSTNN